MDSANQFRLSLSKSGPRTGPFRQLRYARTLLCAAALSSLICTWMPASAHAQVQPWLADRRQRGMGIRAGDLELHPGVAGELGFDSNYAQGSGDEGQATGADDVFLQEPVVPSLRLRVTPSLSVNTLGPARNPQSVGVLPPKFTFNADLALRLNQLFALGAEFDEGSSTRTFIDGDLSLQADVLPRRPWSFGVNAMVSRVAQPSNDPSVVDAVLSRTALTGGGDLRWRPGGGTLEWSVGYDGTYTTFDDESLRLDYVDHGPNIKGRWTFFPQTALLYDGRIGFVSYVSRGNERLVDSTPMTSTLGFNGLITPKIAVLAQAGWKATFFEGNRVPDYDGLIGRAEATWFIASDSPDGVRGFSTLKLGYQRDVANSGISNYYIIDKVFADLSYAAAGVFFVTARAGLGFIKHPQTTLLVLEGNTFAPRDIHELRPDVLVSGEYRLTRNVALLGSLSYTGSMGDNIILLNRNTDGETQYADNLAFSRFTALVGARWFL